MKPGQLISYLAVALAATLLVVAGVFAGWHTATPNAAALRRELLEGVVPAAAHEQLRVRVARQDLIIAELAEESKEMGASVSETQRSAKIVQSTVDGMGARLQAVEGALSEEQEEGARRQMQGAEPEPEPAQGQYVIQIKRDVVPVRTQRCGGPGSTTADGHFDMSRCGDPAWERCHREACVGYNGDHSGGKGGNGHRRAQTGMCTTEDFATRTAEIHAECCDEPGEDCAGGTPHTCNAGCAAAFLPFWADCRSALGEDRGQFEAAVALCEASVTSVSLAEQLNVQCTDGTPAADCVPMCSPSLHGFLMLLNINGEDTKLSCELHHALYSWVGAATDGGYLGSDFQAFFSAVVSGAAGVYVGMLVEDAGISTDLTVTPGQIVSVTGDPSLPQPPAWCVRVACSPSAHALCVA
eukprot:COSAG04_NODE_683_length_11182_cov_15.270775_10_plen_412_part_00